MPAHCSNVTPPPAEEPEKEETTVTAVWGRQSSLPPVFWNSVPVRGEDLPQVACAGSYR
jgi:hypothetical protein